MTALLLDTNISLCLMRPSTDKMGAEITSALHASRNLNVSTASFWEIAIKVRKGKLKCDIPLPDLSSYCASLGIAVHPILPIHVLADVEPLPPTRDPFDQLLLAQPGVQGFRLVTLDHALSAHPLAWRP